MFWSNNGTAMVERQPAARRPRLPKQAQQACLGLHQMPKSGPRSSLERTIDRASQICCADSGSSNVECSKLPVSKRKEAPSSLQEANVALTVSGKPCSTPTVSPCARRRHHGAVGHSLSRVTAAALRNRRYEPRYRQGCGRRTSKLSQCIRSDEDQLEIG